MNTPEQLIKKGVRTLVSFGIGIASLVSPVDAPTNVKADSNELLQTTPTLLHGDGSRNILNWLLVGPPGTTLEMLQATKDDLFSISPMDEFRNKFNVYGLQITEDLGCSNQTAICDWQAVDRVIDRVVGTGTIPHETTVVIKSNDEGGDGKSVLPSHLDRPDIYTFSAVVRPQNIKAFRELHAGTVIHEFLHQFAGFMHEGGDIMGDGNRAGTCHCINIEHTQFLRALKPLVPFNYSVPQNEVRVVAGSLGFKAELNTPTGTTQQKRLITPANNDGPDITLLRNPEGLFEVPAPEIGVGNYILLPGMSYTWKEWSSNHPVSLAWDSPKWDSFEGWPGVFFPNTPAEIKIKTPKRDSDRIGLVTLAGGQETNDLTPILVWNNRDTDVFYYEVQVSKDSTFNTDPSSATAMVYWELRHGGITNPLNSYTIPKEFPLEKGTEYLWRVRPRIQGDGTPVAWSNPGIFKTTADARVQMYSQDLADKDYGHGIIGPSKTDYDRANLQPEVIPAA